MASVVGGEDTKGYVVEALGVEEEVEGFNLDRQMPLALIRTLQILPSTMRR